MATVLGMNCKTYYNTGTFGSPTWVEITNISKMKLTMAGETFDARTRAAGMFHQWACTGIDLTPSWEMNWNLADTAFTALKTAFFAGAEKDMIFLDGSQSSGSHEGPRISAVFTKFDRDEDEANMVRVSLEAKPGTGFLPLWFTGAA